MVKIFVTRYALTDGPWSVEAELKNNGESASWKDVGGARWFMYDKDFWLSEEEALQDCERRRKAKLASIEKQKLKLEKMVFTIK